MSEQPLPLPLIELFTRLRQADVPLGVDDYQLLLHALQAGFGLANRDALARLCQTVWIRSQEHEALFLYHFDQLFPRPADGQLTVAGGGPLGQSARTDDASVSADEQDKPAPPSASTPGVENQAVQAVLHAAGEQDLPYPRFVRSDEYFPVTRRQMKQSWRYIRRPVRQGPRTEVDIAATIREIGRTGMFLDPVLVPPRINRAELVLLIDQGGSMVPFQGLSHRLVESAMRGGRLGEVAVYYFHNCPADYLYCEPTHRGAIAIQKVLDNPRSDSCGVLIVSDAGAARRGFNQQRWEATECFLARCARRFRAIAWLNPTPCDRWEGTTAGKIRRVVPMFDISRRGLDAALVSLRRGREVSGVQTKKGPASWIR